MPALGKIRKRIENLQPKKIRSPRLKRPPYADIHRNKDFLIFGTGPSVERYREKIKDFIDKRGLITIGTNNIWRLYELDYYGFTNRKRFIQNASFLKEKKRSRLIIAPYIARHIIKRHFRGDYWPLMYVDSSRSDFAIDNGVISSSCGTSALTLTGVALVMGAKDIYIAGLDGYSDYFGRKRKINCLDVKTKHSSLKEDKEHYLRLQNFNDRYLKQIDAYFFKKSGRHLKIITPTVYKEYYDPSILGGR